MCSNPSTSSGRTDYAPVIVLQLLSLPESARFERVTVSSKHLIDTVKMVAYRAGIGGGMNMVTIRPFSTTYKIIKL
jgi:hypothetical protein